MWEKKVKKTVYTLNVNGYAPQITELTYPLLYTYAQKIGAAFHVIKERKFPKWPITYEKLQIFELAQQHKNDWNIYIDSDALIHPDCPDFTEVLPLNVVAHHGKDFAPIRWKYDRYFRRHEQHFGTGNWFTLGSHLCIDLWKPLDDLTPKQAVQNIQPTVIERTSGLIDPAHLIDDYALSRNIAKFGLRAVALREYMNKFGLQGAGPYFWHAYTIPIEQKVLEMKKTLKEWGLKP